MHPVFFTGNPPFHELEEDEVERNYEAGVFPDLSGLLCADIITLCWHQGVSLSEQICKMVELLE